MALVSDIQLQTNAVKPPNLDTSQKFSAEGLTATTAMAVTDGGAGTAVTPLGLFTAQSGNDISAVFNTTNTNGDINLYLNNDANPYWNLKLSGTASDSFFISNSCGGNAGACELTALTISTVGAIGIGKTAASTILDITYNNSTTGGVQITDATNSVGTKVLSDSTGGNVGTTTNHKLHFKANDAVKATVDTSGQFGIGTDSPGALLDVRGTVIFNEGGGDYDVRMEGDTDTNLFRLDASTDRIGIGTATPGALLHVEGAACITGGLTFGGAISLQNTLTVGVNDTGYDVTFFGDTSGCKFLWDASADDMIITGGSFLCGDVVIPNSYGLTIGSATQYAPGGSTPELQVQGTGGNDAGIGIGRYSADAYGPNIYMWKSRAAAIGTDTIVQDGDALGAITWAAADGTDIASTAAAIYAEIDGTPASNCIPGAIVFNTTADGASSYTERMRITQEGYVGIGTDPGSIFTVYQSSHTPINFYNTAEGDSDIVFGVDVDGTPKYARLGVDFSNAKSFHLNASGSLADTHLVITQAGLVGIGTGTPCSTLSVHGGDLTISCHKNTSSDPTIIFAGCDTSGNCNQMGQITSCLLSAATNAECGKMVFSLLFQGSDNNSALILCGCTSALTTNIRGPLCGICGICVACGGAFGGSVGIGTATISHMLHVDAADGEASGCVVANIRNNEATAGQNYGLYVLGGSNSSDYNSAFHDVSGNVLMEIQGDGSVGIGTSAPAYPLHVVRGSTNNYVAQFFTSEGNGLLLGNWGSNYSVITTNTTQDLYFSIGGNMKMMIDGTDGYVGIGTASPSSLLHLYSATTDTPSLRIENANSDATEASIAFLKTTSSTADADRLGGVRWCGCDDAGNVQTYAHFYAKAIDVSSGSEDAGIFFDTLAAGSWVSPTLAIRSGQVGIGTDAPADLFHIQAGASGISPVNSATQMIMEQDADHFYAEFITDTDKSGGFIWNDGAQAAYFQYDNSCDQFQFAPGNSFSVAMNSSGSLVRGTKCTICVLGGKYAGIQNHATSATNSGIFNVRWSNDTSAGSLYLGKSRSTTIGAHGIVTTGDYAGGIIFTPDDGTDFDSKAATIYALVEGTVGANSTPGVLTFGTAAASSNQATERMRIDSSGKVGIATTAPDATLHVHTASAGSITPDTDADDLVVENSGRAGISILTPDAQSGKLIFGSASDAVGASIAWNHDSDLMTLGTNNAGASLAFNSANGAEAIRIDSNGNVIVGHTSPVPVGGTTCPVVEILGTGNADSRMSLGRYSNDNSGAAIMLFKSRGGTIGTSAVLQDNDEVGQINFLGTDGSAADNFVAQVKAEVDGTPTTDTVPGALIFSTAAQGNQGASERMRIDSSGKVGIGTTAPDEQLHLFSSASCEPVIKMENTNTNAYPGGVLEFYKNTSAGNISDSDGLGSIDFYGNNDAGTPEKIGYACIISWLSDYTDGTEDGTLDFAAMMAGTIRSKLRLSPTEAVFNEGGVDVDFRIESDNNANAFFVEGSSGNVGIGTASPAGALSVWAAGCEALRVNTSGRVGIGGDAAQNNLEIINCYPKFALYDCDGATDQKWLAMKWSSGTLEWSVVNDAYSASDRFMNVVSTGANVDKIVFETDNETDRLVIDGACLGIGTASPGYGVHYVGDITATGGTSTYGTIWAQCFCSSSSGTASHQGHNFAAYKTGANDFTNSAVGLSAITALVDDVSGATGTVTHAAGIEVLNGSMPGGAAFTTKSGIYVAEQTGGTNNYAIYALGDSYFSGNVGIGVTAPGSSDDTCLGFSYVAELQVEGNSPTFSDDSNINLRFIDRGAGSNAKLGDIVYDAQTWQFRTITDAGGAGNANVLFVDGANAKVGIGTGSPDVLLETSGSGTGTSSVTAETQAIFGNTGATGCSSRVSIVAGTAGYSVLDFGDTAVSKRGAVAYKQDEELMIFNTNTTDQMWLDSNGNLGIGTAAPGGLIHAYTADAGSATASTLSDEIIIESNDNAGLTVMVPDGKSGRIMFTSPSSTGSAHAEIQSSYDSGNLNLNTNKSGAHIAFLTDTASEAMRIDSSGRMGLGTTTPCEKLEVYNGDLAIKCYASGGTGAGGTILFIGCDDNSLYIETGQITSCLLSAATNAECGKMVFGLAFQGGCNQPAVILCGCSSALTTNIRGPLCGVCGANFACAVGIGTTAPFSLLHIQAGASGATSAAETDSKFILEQDADHIYTEFITDNDKAGGFIWSSSAGAAAQASKKAWFQYQNNTSNEGYFQIAPGNSASMTWLHDGKVGIGTSAPLGNLHVQESDVAVTPDSDGDNLIIEANGRAGISILSADNEGGKLIFGSASDATGAAVSWYHDSDILYVGTIHASAELSLRTGENVEAVRIDDSGNVGIGTAAIASSKLRVEGGNICARCCISVVGNICGLNCLIVANNASIVGSLSKGSGTFNIVHPCEDTTTPNEYNSKRLIHGFIEGPKHGIQYDGEAVLCDGIALVKLPEYFDKLASRDAPIHIQLTNIDGWTPLVVKLQSSCKVCGNCFYVCTIDDGVKDAKFDWQVSASRGDKFVKEDTTSTDDRGLLCVEMWEDSGHAKESEIDVLTTVQLKEYMDYNTITYTGSENDSELASLIMAEQTRRLPD